MAIVDSFLMLVDNLGMSDAAISDADSTLRFSQLPDLGRKIDADLRAQGVEGCVALECENSVAVVAVMLALLARGQHLLLVPSQGNALKEPGFTPDIPDFCRFHLTVTPRPDNDLGHGLNVYLNQQFQPSAYERLTAHCGDTPQVLLRTSGSMGDAKIARFTHAKLLANAANCVARFELTPQSRVMLAVPTFHMYGLGAGLIPGLLAGANLHILANVNILRFLESERRFRPDVVYLNPTLVAMLLKGRRDQPPFSRTISAGAALPEELYHSYRERFGPLINLYGSTEMGAVATTPFDSDQPNRLLPLPGVEMHIRDDHALYCQHPYGFEGYLNRHGELLPVANNPYNTGDVARLLADGRFELLGRQSDSVNRAGFLVQFSDIENALLRTGEVEQAVVLCSNEETWRGPKLYAFCIPVAGKIVTAQTIREACFAHLPRYAVPDEVLLETTFPRSATDKIDRRRLQQKITELN